MKPNQSQQTNQKPKNYLKVSKDFEKRLASRKASTDVNIGYEITREMTEIAEFGMMYGWQAVRDVLNDDIEYEDFHWLLGAGRRVDVRKQYANMTAMFFAKISAQSKDPKKTFDTLSKQYLKEMEADL